MLIVALKPSHDGAIAVLDDGDLRFCLEPEKDSNVRYAGLTPTTVLDIAEQLDRLPDAVALGGWDSEDVQLVPRDIGAGYRGIHSLTVSPSRFFGKEVELFSSSHDRSHLMMAIGMSPPSDAPLRTVLVWEGDTGRLYLVGREHEVLREVSVMTEPGGRYGLLFALADPTFRDDDPEPRLGDAGKLMALAAFGDPDNADAATRECVDRILSIPTVYDAPKAQLRDLPLHNAGVQSELAVNAAALLSRHIFTTFADAARRLTPAGTPLLISGGCGLNCDWNRAWMDLGHHSSVFVPPCPNDSGSAIGTAIDAQHHFTGDPHIRWDAYRGLDFVEDSTPDRHEWSCRPLEDAALAEALSASRVVAWVQGRWEIGPRALGHRSILAEPFLDETRERLNTIKGRERYRPIAPCCRVEDLADAFDASFEDPHMLYFRRVRDPRLRAVTHVDGSARVQTVSAETNARLHSLLTAFAAQRGIGALCNTSLNFRGRGFINRTSDLVQFCRSTGIDDMVIGDRWFQRVR